MAEAGVTGVIPKAGGSNNEDFPLYLETVHQGPAREVFGTIAQYWANGQVGTPTEIANRIANSGIAKKGERFGWDVETWPNEAREWNPDEVYDVAVALDAHPSGIPCRDQFVYLSLAQLRRYDWTKVVELGLLLWIAAWDTGPVLVKYWDEGGVWLRQYTSGSNAEIRKVYNADLDLNRPPDDVWVVRELQRALNARGATLTVDNKYGPATEAAVRVHQLANGLLGDGDAGRLTLGTLTKV